MFGWIRRRLNRDRPADLGGEVAALGREVDLTCLRIYNLTQAIYYHNPNRRPLYPPIDLERFRPVLGDPSRYFVDADRITPIVVLHETGEPHYAVVDGELIPYADWSRDTFPAHRYDGRPELLTGDHHPCPASPST
jgi:hypothetical protein